jgi:Ca-activated chloride channel family protein
MTLSTPILSSPYRMHSAPVAIHEPERQGAELCTTDGRTLPLVSCRLRAEAGAGLCRYVLEQTFENPHEETLHVVYKMPLPADGAVSGYAFQIGARRVTGHVEPKEAAREMFERAIASGKTAALLEQERPDIFTQKLGNVPARERIVATITVDQRLAWLPEGEWEMRFPTVIGPRYIGSSETADDVRAVHIKVAKELAARLHLEVRVHDTLSAGRRVESPSHALLAQADGTFSLVSDEGTRLDRDVVVRWAVAKPEVGLSLVTARPDAKKAHAGEAYGLLTIVPPLPEAGFEAVSRDLIVLLDTSGSMGGPPLEQAKRVVARIIDSLGDGDRLELIEFSMRPHRYGSGPVAASAKEKQKAIAWVNARTADGGTEMHSAVVDALRALRPGAQRQVVLVTDGYIGGEEQLVTLLHERLPESCRLHVVGVGSAVNRTLSASMARAGRGVEILSELGEDVERACKRLLDRMAYPVLTDVVLEGEAVIEKAPEHLPDVFAGSPVLAALKLSAKGGEIVVRGKLARGTWEKRITVPAVAAGEGNQAVVSLFGRELVADLEMRWTIGRETQMIDRTIERAGLVFQIATRRTSWVAIDDLRETKVATRTEIVPQELPYGTSVGSFGLAMPAPYAAAAFDGAVMAPAAMAPLELGRFEEESADRDEEQTSVTRTGTLMAPPAPAARAVPRPAPAAPAAMPPMQAPSIMAEPMPVKRPAPRWPWVLLLMIIVALIVALLVWNRA